MAALTVREHLDPLKHCVSHLLTLVLNFTLVSEFGLHSGEERCRDGVAERAANAISRCEQSDVAQESSGRLGDILRLVVAMKDCPGLEPAARNQDAERVDGKLGAHTDCDLMPHG